VCYSDGQTNPQDVCQICDLSASDDSWSDNDSVACDDGLYCTGDDTCLGGSCSQHSGDPCLDDGIFCNGPEECIENDDSCRHDGDPCVFPEMCYEDVGACMTGEEYNTPLWEGSGHADTTSPAFNHWNSDVPPEVPAACARCHSTPGFIDYVPDLVVSSSVPIGTVIDCTACHEDQSSGLARNIPSVEFPSGATIDGLGPSSLCAACHQGRASTLSVDVMIAAAGVGVDTTSSSLRFVNVHYTAAAATQFGTLVTGGYQYSGKLYDARFTHGDMNNDCMACHDQHSLAVDLTACSQCHQRVIDTWNIRAYGSFVDYDGDGDTDEGIYYEVEGVRARLFEGIRLYASAIALAPIGHHSTLSPHFFYDTNNDGAITRAEADYANRYRSFTPRLLRAAYNYHFSVKDGGGYAHGGKYIIELLYDSLLDLNVRLGGMVSMSGMHRVDEGHFDGSLEAFRHWDADPEVPAACARCHTPAGLPYFVENDADVDQEQSNGLVCSTCHTTDGGTHNVATVEFPSGVVADLGDSSNLCLTCHQGRASKSVIDAFIASGPGPYDFVNPHYAAEAAVFFGSDVHGGYEYPAKVYAGRKPFANHMGRYDNCVECHKATNTLRGVRVPSDHNTRTPNPEDCLYCHGADIAQPFPGADPERFRFYGIRPATTPDYDADGNSSEGIRNEIWSLQAGLYAQMQAYGFAIGSPLVYSGNTYPYFFRDNNGNGLVDPGEAIVANRYRFNARLLKAGYNYQLSQKAPAGYIHNSLYIAQLLVDSIGDLGGNVAPYTWR
jgi:hypothetical protein